MIWCGRPIRVLWAAIVYIQCATRPMVRAMASISANSGLARASGV
jgi:hypothetical protein